MTYEAVIAQVQEIAELTKTTEYTATGILAIGFAFALWWMIWVYKPQYERRVNSEISRQDKLALQEEKESERRIAREDENARKQNKLFDVMSEAIPLIHETMAEFHKENAKNHEITHEKLDAIASRKQEL